VIRYSTIIVVSILALALVFNTGSIYAKSKSEKTITKAIGKAVEGKWGDICIAAISTKNNLSDFATAYNNTKCLPIVPQPPEPPTCKPSEHLENGKCVPNVTPSPGNSTTVCATGDISGTAVHDAMVKGGCGVTLGLGDLTYASTLAAFKSQHFTKCVIGNHDAEENGSPQIYQEALAYCGNSWWLKPNNNTIFFGLNTNAKSLTPQLDATTSLLNNATLMHGVKNVYFVSHKPICSTPPNSHHPLESKPVQLCNPLIDAVPNGIRLNFINGHNHVMAETMGIEDLAGGVYVTAGGGGKSHYTCGVDDIWKFCNNSDYGYLKLIIDNNNGQVVSNFYSVKGVKLN